MPVNEPGGWFLGQRPGGPKPKREGWETQTYVCMYGGFLMLFLGLTYGPTTTTKLPVRNIPARSRSQTKGSKAKRLRRHAYHTATVAASCGPGW